MTIQSAERPAAEAAFPGVGDEARRGDRHLEWPTHSENEDAIRRVLRILSRRAREPAARASAALDRLLRDLRVSPWADVAWSFSRLTADRFPVEFTFSSSDSSIRYTTEVAGPERDEGERLPRAIRHLVRLGAASPPDATTVRLRRMQESGPLRFGTWIGGRHDRDGDRYKLYVEAPGTGPPEVERFVREHLGSGSLLPARGVPLRLHMVGLDPASSGMELYFRGPGLEPWEVGLLLRRVGLKHRLRDLLGLVEEAWARSTRDALPGANVGFSFSVGPSAPVFSLFFFARSVFGADGRIRSGILALAERKGWDFADYEAVTSPLAGRTSRRTNHLTVAFVVSSDTAPSLGIGVRPPGTTR